MYAIIKCRFCGHIQGSQYPVKTTECKRCSKRNNLDKIGPIGIYNEFKEMQAHLIGMKWDDKTTSPEDYILKEGFGKKEITKLRDVILESISDDGTTLADLFSRLKEMGFEEQIIIQKLDDLKLNGLIYSPRDGYLKKVQ